jgi:hypothetical protein
LRLVDTKPCVDLGGRPVGYAGLRSPAGLSERAGCVSRGFAPALVLDEPIQPGPLLIVQEVVKLLQRRLNRLDPANHGLDPLLHGCEPLGRGQRYLCRTGSFNLLRRFHGGVGEIIERRTLAVI